MGVEDDSDVVQVELTQVDVVEPMEETEDESLLLDEQLESANDNVIGERKTEVAMERTEDDMDADVDGETRDTAAEYLPNENEVFSEDESEDSEEEGVGNGSIEENIEIESIVDRNEDPPRLESDVESIADNGDSSDSNDDESEEEESEEDDEESLADEDTECEDEENSGDESGDDESGDDEVLVKEESAIEEDESPTDDIKSNPIVNIQEEEKLLIENNNKENIKKEQNLDVSDFEFL